MGWYFLFIRGIAEYEKMLDQVEATEAILHQSLFVDHQAEAVIGEYQGSRSDFALLPSLFPPLSGAPVCIWRICLSCPPCVERALANVC